MVQIITYKMKTDRADENAQLIEGVFTELAKEQPTDVEYSSFRHADGVHFTHIINGNGQTLSALPAFQTFQKDFNDRVSEGPGFTEAERLGSYYPNQTA